MLLRVFLRQKSIQAWNLRRAARAVLYLFNLHTCIVLMVSWVSVWVCHYQNWRFAIDFSMVSTGTVFPLTFTLAQAFTRRERATALIASIKASAVALFFMHRDWDQTQAYPSSLGVDSLPGPRRAKQLLVDLLLNMRRYLVCPSRFESVAEARLTASHHEYLGLFEHNLHLTERDKLFKTRFAELMEGAGGGRKWLKECYRCLSQLSVLNEKLTLAAGYTRGGEGGLSRTSQYLRYLMANLEELRSIKEYRTPTMMRHACAILIHVFAVVLAPYFVHSCADSEAENCVAGYASASVYVLICMLLLHVQQDLENCLDESGLDDAFFTSVDELDELAGEPMLQSARSSCSDMSRLVRAGSPLGPGLSQDVTGLGLEHSTHPAIFHAYGDMGHDNHGMRPSGPRSSKQMHSAMVREEADEEKTTLLKGFSRRGSHEPHQLHQVANGSSCGSLRAAGGMQGAAPASPVRALSTLGLREESSGRLCSGSGTVGVGSQARGGSPG
ncbi:hypothetical protein V8C86DRAFT_2449307 [Haematococcus lacustris]